MISRNARLLANALSAVVMAAAVCLFWLSSSFGSDSWARVAGMSIGAVLCAFFLVGFMRTLALPKDGRPTLDESPTTRWRRVWIVSAIAAGVLAPLVGKQIGIDISNFSQRARPWIPVTFLFFGIFQVWFLLRRPREASPGSRALDKTS
jgi:hypothetical protein